MKYLCLGYLDPQAMDARPPEEIDALMSKCGPHLHTLYQTGKVVSDAGLTSQSRVLRRVKGKLVVTDGPFVETKELLGSALVIEAKDFDEAVKVAALHPTVQLDAGEGLGWRLELRPIHYFKGS